MSASGANSEPARLHLPDFCATRAVFTIVLIVEITALILTLAHTAEGRDFWSEFAGAAVFLLWVGLCGAAILCRLRVWLENQSVTRAALAILAAMGALVALISGLAYQLGRTYLIGPELGHAMFPVDRGAFVLRNVGVGVLVCALALRYFYVAQQWRRNVEMQAHARVNALQARIRPHFLFNSMNTIAALTRSSPAQAEEAVQDLADLFRATLSERNREVLLEEELEIATTYQRIEQLRLGERLQVAWHIDPLPRRAVVPGLMLQPLLENAIYHGIDPLPLGGVVTITGEFAHGLITLMVRNPVGHSPLPREGNRMALANIRERLELMYGERATIKSGRFDDEFIVTLRFPYVEAAVRLRA
jgi:two-component system sensor histidine kinase AlgZ